MYKKMGWVILLAAISGLASAKGSCKSEWFLGFLPIDICTPGDRHHAGDHDHDSSPKTAPEIDPASAIVAVSLALGGLAVLRDRRSRIERA